MKISSRRILAGIFVFLALWPKPFVHPQDLPDLFSSQTPASGDAKPADVAASPQTKSNWQPPRRRPRYKNFRKKSAKPKGPPKYLGTGRWLPENRKALEQMIFDKSASANPDAQIMPPVAVFVLDDVSVIHHAGEAVFYRLVTQVEFKFNDEFWNLLPPPLDHKVKMGYDEFKDESRIVWPKDPFYMLYRKSFFQAYQILCRQQGRKTCHSWLTSLLKDFSEEEAAQYMHKAIPEAMRHPVGREPIPGDAQDPDPLRANVGIQIIPEFKDLIHILLKHGFEVWLLSSSNQWAAEEVGWQYGVTPDHVKGIKPQIKKKILQTTLEQPIPDGVGEAEAVTSLVGRDPALAVGGSAMDKEMLQYGKGLRLVMDQGDPDFVKEALSRGWLVQPAFLP